MALSLLAMILTNGSPEIVDTVRLALEDSSAGWFSLVKHSGYAVAVGCAMEAPETIIVIKRWWYLKLRNIDEQETVEDRKGWPVPLAAIGLLLIVIGIVSETFGESKVSDVDALLRAHESDKITQAEKEAASATRDAGTAKDSAHAAIDDAAGAKVKADSAKLEADSAQVKAESVLSVAAEASKSATDALAMGRNAKAQLGEVQSNIAKVEAKYATRTLSTADAIALGNILQILPNKPSDPILVESYVGAPDGVRYALQIVDAINAPRTGWKAKFRGQNAGGGNFTGVVILIHDGASIPKWATGLQVALSQIGIVGQGETDDFTPKGTATILVCSKN